MKRNETKSLMPEFMQPLQLVLKLDPFCFAVYGYSGEGAALILNGKYSKPLTGNGH